MNQRVDESIKKNIDKNIVFASKKNFFPIGQKIQGVSPSPNTSKYSETASGMPESHLNNFSIS